MHSLRKSRYRITIPKKGKHRYTNKTRSSRKLDFVKSTLFNPVLFDFYLLPLKEFQIGSLCTNSTIITKWKRIYVQFNVSGNTIGVSTSNFSDWKLKGFIGYVKRILEQRISPLLGWKVSLHKDNFSRQTVKRIISWVQCTLEQITLLRIEGVFNETTRNLAQEEISRSAKWHLSENWRRNRIYRSPRVPWQLIRIRMPV